MTILPAEFCDEDDCPLAGFAGILSCSRIAGAEEREPMVPVGEPSRPGAHAEFLMRAAVDDYETEE